MNVSIQEITSILDDCWNRIGVWSKNGASCPKLDECIHCRNCRHYSAAGKEILNRPAPEEYRVEWAERFATPEQPKESGANSALLFRLGDEWLALKSCYVQEITQFRPIHSLPHRDEEIIKGLVNIRGELKICISIGAILHLDKARESHTCDREIHERMIYVANGENSFVFPVSEVHGIHHFAEKDLEPIPLTVSRSKQTFTTKILPWKVHHVGVLDHELLFYALENALK
jgi:chemotaxis-related protein WspD